MAVGEGNYQNPQGFTGLVKVLDTQLDWSSCWR